MNPHKIALLANWMGIEPIMLSYADMINASVNSRISSSSNNLLLVPKVNRQLLLNIKEVRSIWSRGFELIESFPPAKSAQNLIYFQWRYYIEYLIDQLKSSYWMNSHQVIANTSNRLNQLDVARSFGFYIPETIVTNDVNEVKRFISDLNAIVVKHISSGHPRECADRVLLTRDFCYFDLEQLRENIVVCPTMFQERIEKLVELRITVVGQHIFCAGLRIQKQDHVDSRATTNRNTYCRWTLDSDTESKVKGLVDYFDLKYAAIDLAIDKLGRLVFFEINHSGQWGYIEQSTGFKIGQTIMEELACHA